MKLEAGKKYKTRGGYFASILEINLKNSIYDQALGVIYRNDLTSHVCSWSITGYYTGTSDHDSKDLVSEYKEPEEVPLSYEDAELIISKGWVKDKSNKRIEIISSIEVDAVYVDGYMKSYQDLKDYYTWADGTPCSKTI